MLDSPWLAPVSTLHPSPRAVLAIPATRATVCQDGGRSSTGGSDVSPHHARAVRGAAGVSSTRRHPSRPRRHFRSIAAWRETPPDESNPPAGILPGWMGRPVGGSWHLQTAGRRNAVILGMNERHHPAVWRHKETPFRHRIDPGGLSAGGPFSSWGVSL